MDHDRGRGQRVSRCNQPALRVVTLRDDVPPVPFAKIERLAVRHQFRRSRVSFKLVQAAVEYIKRKGFKKIYGLAQDRLALIFTVRQWRTIDIARTVKSCGYDGLYVDMDSSMWHPIYYYFRRVRPWTRQVNPAWGEVPAEKMITTNDVAEGVRFLLRLSPNCIVPEITFARPDEGL